MDFQTLLPIISIVLNGFMVVLIAFTAWRFDIRVNIAEQITESLKNIQYFVNNLEDKLKNFNSTSSEIPLGFVSIEISDADKIQLSLFRERIDALETLYSIVYLLDNPNNITGYLWNEDVPAEDRLIISSILSGSIWVTIGTTTNHAMRSLSKTLPLLFRRGRDLTIEDMDTRVKRNKVALDRDRLELNTHKAKAAIEIANAIEKVKDPEIRHAMKKAFKHNMDVFDKSPDDDNAGLLA